MNKVKQTKKIKKDIIDGVITVHVGVDVINNLKDKVTPPDLVAALEGKGYVLSEKGGKYFMVTEERYESMINPAPPAAVTSAQQAKPVLKITKVETIWEHRKDFIAAFPTLENVFDKYRKAIGDGSLTCCTANAKKVELSAKAVGVYVQTDGMVMPDKLRKLLDPYFSKHLAIATATTPPPAGSLAVDPGGIITPARHSHQSEGYRPTCLDCVRKHIAQAMILLQESESPEYKNHFWLGIGHLAEAESESLSSYPTLANTIRDHRLSMMADRNYKPDLTNLFEIVDTTETSNG